MDRDTKLLTELLFKSNCNTSMNYQIQMMVNNGEKLTDILIENNPTDNILNTRCINLNDNNINDILLNIFHYMSEIPRTMDMVSNWGDYEEQKYLSDKMYLTMCNYAKKNYDIIRSDKFVLILRYLLDYKMKSFEDKEGDSDKRKRIIEIFQNIVKSQLKSIIN